MSYFKSTFLLNISKFPFIFKYELSLILALKSNVLKVKLNLSTFNSTLSCSLFTLFSIYEATKEFP